MKFEVAQLNDDDTPSKVRFGFTKSENSAAHVALATMRKFSASMCVVEVTPRGERIVQFIRYYPTGIAIQSKGEYHETQ